MHRSIVTSGLLAAALAALLGFGPRAEAQTAAQAQRLAFGKVVAESWCANCHVVGRQARGPVADAAPPFAAIAAMPSTTEMSLR
ncbi:MAG: hypothetical protein K2X74_21230, partial [Acetobacteraceae bacterium]|nr:hypothetical protein [Acetobacteraceae bacterium]